MFTVVTSVLMRCWFGNLRVCVCVCSGLLLYAWFFGFLGGGGLVLGLIRFGLLDTRQWIKSKNTLQLKKMERITY
jgi:hypothetical protein